jgi:rfaE bifunctional protein kinase chain/domain
MTRREILDQFPKLSALVVGDICLDRWCTYDPSTAEPSRETGIPRIGVIATEVTPGAGGTVANNLAALGVGKTAVLGTVGDDGFSYELTHALEARGIEASLLVRTPGIQTFTYTKVINADSGEEDRPRIDFINTCPLAAEIEQEVISRLRSFAPEFDVLLVADQAETDHGGVVTPAVRRAIEEIAEGDPRKVVWVDSRMRPELFRRAIIKPNDEEARAACRRLFGRTDFQALRAHAAAPLLIITHGGDGALIVSEAGEQWVATHRVENPVDICGAGDSFSAGAALAYAVTRDPAGAVRFGNRVASLTIMKRGTGTASPQEVVAAE